MADEPEPMCPVMVPERMADEVRAWVARRIGGWRRVELADCANLPARVATALHADGVRTLGQAADHIESGAFLRIPNVGRVALRHVLDAIKAAGGPRPHGPHLRPLEGPAA